MFTITREHYECVFSDISVHAYSHTHTHVHTNDPLPLRTRWPSWLTLREYPVCALTSTHVRAIARLRQSRASLYIDRGSAGRIQFIWYTHVRTQTPARAQDKPREDEKKKKREFNFLSTYCPRANKFQSLKRSLTSQKATLGEPLGEREMFGSRPKWYRVDLGEYSLHFSLIRRGNTGVFSS